MNKHKGFMSLVIFMALLLSPFVSFTIKGGPSFQSERNLQALQVRSSSPSEEEKGTKNQRDSVQNQENIVSSGESLNLDTSSQLIQTKTSQTQIKSSEGSIPKSANFDQECPNFPQISLNQDYMATNKNLIEAVVRYKSKNFLSALQKFESQRKAREEKFGQDYQERLKIVNYIGLCHLQLKNYSQAMISFEEAVSLEIKRSGEESLDTSMAIYSLGFTQYKRGNYSEAQKHFLRALAIEKKIKGQDDQFRSLTVRSLAETSRRLGKYRQTLNYHIQYYELNGTNDFQVYKAEIIRLAYEQFVTKRVLLYTRNQFQASEQWKYLVDFLQRLNPLVPARNSSYITNPKVFRDYGQPYISLAVDTLYVMGLIQHDKYDGSTNKRLFNHTKGLKIFEQALELELGETDDDRVSIKGAEIMRRISLTYFRMNNIQKSTAYIQKYIKVVRDNKQLSPLDLSRLIFRAYAYNSYFFKDQKKQLMTIVDFLKSSNQTQSAIMAKVLFRIAYLQGVKKNTSEALRYYNQSLQIFKNVNKKWPNVPYLILSQMAELEKNITGHNEQLQRLKDTVDLLCQSNQRQWRIDISRIYRKIAEIYYFDLQNYNQSLRYYQKSVSVVDFQDVVYSTSHLVRVLIRIGQTNQRKGTFQQSIVPLKTANQIAAYNEKNLFSILVIDLEAQISGLLGKSYVNMNQFQNALEQFEKQAKIHKSNILTQVEYKTARNNIGYTYRLMKRYNQSIEALEQQQTGFSMDEFFYQNQLESSTNMSLIYFETGDIKKYNGYIRVISYQALQIIKLTKDTFKVYTNAINIGRISNLNKTFDDTIILLQSALLLQLLIKGKISPEKAALRYELAFAYQGKRNYKKALNYYSQAQELYTRVLGEHSERTKNARRAVERVKKLI